MNKAKLKYVKYTKKELDQYVRDKNSCVSMHTSEMHVGFPPWGFVNFQETLTNIISRDKIGKYDTKLEGIILDVRNIKVYGTLYPVRDDDPINHINLKADFYVFQPRIGALIKGVVKHISHGHIAVIIYRVFNVSIRFNRENVRDSLKINQQISFRIKKFDLSGAMPYIEGEFIGVDAPKTTPKNGTALNKHSRFDDDETGASGGDSGISTEDTNTSNLRKKVGLKKEKESESSSSEDSSSSDESSSDEDSDANSKANLVDQFLKGVSL